MPTTKLKIRQFGFDNSLFSLILLEICIISSLNAGCSYKKYSNICSCSGIAPKYSDSAQELCLENSQNVTILEIQNCQRKFLSIKKLIINYPNLSNLTIWKGNISLLMDSFLPNNKIRILQLKNLTLERISPLFLKSLTNLEILDLSGNYLKTINTSVIETLNYIQDVKLARNRWNCSLNLDWILNLNKSIFSDLSDLKCFQAPYPGKPMIDVAQFAINVRVNCPSKCDCTMPEVVRDPINFKLEPIIEVNCSERALTQLPRVLPAKTKILLLQGNKISGLDLLVNNSVYKNIQDVFLDNNLISSIGELEGVYWLSHFRVMSLRNNKLSQVPTYALDNALQKNPNMPIAVRIYLGNNPWRCDCIYLPRFQELLRKYEAQVRDIEDIKCPSAEGDLSSFTQVLELSRSSVCRTTGDYSIRILDLVNGILASLIVLILGKLAYDYYYFKRTGKLPWIVTKLP